MRSCACHSPAAAVSGRASRAHLLKLLDAALELLGAVRGKVEHVRAHRTAAAARRQEHRGAGGARCRGGPGRAVGFDVRRLGGSGREGSERRRRLARHERVSHRCRRVRRIGSGSSSPRLGRRHDAAALLLLLALIDGVVLQHAGEPSLRVEGAALRGSQARLELRDLV